jgi:hypothetical protein
MNPPLFSDTCRKRQLCVRKPQIDFSNIKTHSSKGVQQTLRYIEEERVGPNWRQGRIETNNFPGYVAKGAFMKRTTSGLPFAIALAVLLLFAAGAVRAQADPFLGTWELNVSKSMFVPGPPRRSETRMAESSPMDLKVSIKRVNGDGSTQENEYTSNLDGKSYPIIGQGAYGADSIAAKLTAPNTIQSTLNTDGKVVATGTSVVSNHGKVLTVTTKGVDASGKPFNNVAVYDKQ